MNLILNKSILIFLLLTFISCKNENRGKLITSIPFDFRKGCIYIKLKINNQGPFDFIFDTGAPNLVIESSIANKLNLNFNKVSRPFQTPQGCFNLVLGNGICSISNDNFIFKHEYYSIIKKRFPSDFDGIIGSQFFEKYIVRLDFKKHILELYSSYYPYNDKGMTFSLIGKDEPYMSLITEIVLPNDKIIKGPFIIDSGSDVTVVYDNNNRIFSDTNTLKYKQNIYFDLSGRFIKLIQIKSKYFKFNEYCMSNIPIYIQDICKTNSSGKIGMDILQHFNISFDFRHKKIIMDPIDDITLANKKVIEYIEISK